jgi:predicted lactoylglutathione lyase
VLNCLSVGSREEADDLLSRALSGGGKSWLPAQDHGVMYGTSVTDPDGNVWETMWMDPSVLAG